MRVASDFILHSPPGEFNEVFNGKSLFDLPLNSPNFTTYCQQGSWIRNYLFLTQSFLSRSFRIRPENKAMSQIVWTVEIFVQEMSDLVSVPEKIIPDPDPTGPKILDLTGSGSTNLSNVKVCFAFDVWSVFGIPIWYRCLFSSRSWLTAVPL